MYQAQTKSLLLPQFRPLADVLVLFQKLPTPV